VEVSLKLQNLRRRAGKMARRHQNANVTVEILRRIASGGAQANQAIGR
jgi:hypothetical protein